MDELVQRVREFAIERVEQTLAAGYLLRRGHWSIPKSESWESTVHPDAKGCACAVGAIAFNGAQPNQVQTYHDTFAVARPHLFQLGVTELSVAEAIVEAISDGFEGSHHSSAPPWARPYFDLGVEIWEAYGDDDDEDED